MSVIKIGVLIFSLIGAADYLLGNKLGIGKEYEKIYSETFESFFGLEGPECYYLDDMKKWCLIADRYHGDLGYAPFVTDNLDSGVYTQLSPDQYDLGKRKKRHGGIIRISHDVAEKLKKYYE